MTELNDLTDLQYKTLENRLRRKARRQGLQLVKSRSRDPQACDYQRYVLARDGWIVGGDMSLDGVEKFLAA